MCVEYNTETGVDILVNIIDKNGNQSQYKKAKIKPGKKIWKSMKD